MQTACGTRNTLRQLGLVFSCCAGQLSVRPRSMITSEIRATIKAHRDQVLRCIEAESSAACEHKVLERAAVLKFDGGRSRANADRLALAEFDFSSWDELTAGSAGSADP